MKNPRKNHAGYTTIELLLFLLAITVVVAFSFKDAQKEMKEMQDARTKAAETEISYRKERYLFESSPTKIDAFNKTGDEARWETLSEVVLRGGSPTKDPIAFIKYSGKSKLFIGRDSEDVLLSP